LTYLVNRFIFYKT